MALCAVWPFSFQERFFAVKLRSYSQAAENAAMAVLVTSRWHRGYG